MDRGYIHYEITRSQAPMKKGAPCGDLMGKDRTTLATTVILADGLGHGVKARISAQLCVSRLLGLIRSGVGARQAFAGVIKTMETAKETDMPYSAFSMVRIFPDGMATVLSYEAPNPILVSGRFAEVLPGRPAGGLEGVAAEFNCRLDEEDSLLVMSDGITQAGLGMGISGGWGAEGVAHYVTDLKSDGASWQDIPASVLERARRIWGGEYRDDCSAVLITARPGKTVTILTGPPSDRRLDRKVLGEFVARQGAKVVSGGSTARMLAEYLDRELKFEKRSENLYSPTRYFIDGIDLVTEGTITLNQVYNVLEEDEGRLEGGSVAELHRLLKEADRVDFLVGDALNPANENIAFQQQGILSRKLIVPLISAKLREIGKLVVEEYI